MTPQNDLSLDQVPPSLMGPGNSQLERPFPQFSNVTWLNPSIGNSTYHAGFVRVEKRMSGGLSFLAHYTFSKFLDDVEAANEFGTTGSGCLWRYAANPGLTPNFRRSLPEIGCLSQGLPHGTR